MANRTVVFECMQRMVDLATIDAGDATYRITTTPVDAVLETSIAALGLLNPPMLIEKKSNFYGILSGFRRVDACRRLHCRQLPARIAAPTVDLKTYAAAAVAENSLQRPLNLVETARALGLIAATAGSRQALETTAAALGLPCRYPIIEKILPLRFFSPIIQQGVIDSTLSLKTALALGNMQPEAGELLAGWFVDLKPSHSKQREMYTNLEEIALRENISLLKVAREMDLPALAADPEPDRNRKIAILRERIRRRRYPVITAAEKQIKQAIRALDPGPGIALKPPAHLESSVFVFQLDFKSIAELKTRLQRLTRLADGKKLAEIIKPA